MNSEYDETVNALNAGAKLPDVRRESYRPGPSLLVAVTMMATWVLFVAIETWQVLDDASTLLVMVTFLLLRAWARQK